MAPDQICDFRPHKCLKWENGATSSRYKLAFGLQCPWVTMTIAEGIRIDCSDKNSEKNFQTFLNTRIRFKHVFNFLIK